MLKQIFDTSTTYELSLARDYVLRWGMAEAVRELIQNAIDSDAAFEYEFGATSLRIRSAGVTLPVKSLLLGSTSKADCKDKIGSFGEGFKIALLVLTRLGYPVQVLNGDQVWLPSFRMSRTYQAEVLCITADNAPVRNDGLDFIIECLSPNDIEAIRDSCLHMQKSVGAVYQTQYGRILRERPGLLYVGGLFVCKTKLAYGYDVDPAHLKLERDRQTVSNFDLQFLTKDMWFDTERWEDIAGLIEADIPDLEYAEYSAPEMVKEACYKLFRAKHPTAVIAKDQAELDKLVRDGMVEVIVSRPWAPIVQQSKHYKAEGRIVTVTPHQYLTQWLSDNRGNMRTPAIVAFKELLRKAEHWHLK